MSNSKLDVTRNYIRTMYSDGEEFRFDLLSRKTQILDDNLQWRNLTDKDICTIACNCAQATGANITDREVRCVLGSDLVRDVHPLREYIRSLPPYNADYGIDFIQAASEQVRIAAVDSGVSAHSGKCTMHGDAQGLWAEYFKKWFVAMVAGWMYDDVVNHQVLVLIGRQGTGKTTWLEHLLPPELRDYVTKQASVRELGKDDRIRIAEFGLINMDEIDSCSPRELNVLKSLITTADVNERAAYGHTKERRIRCASFCASGNNREFLSDDTGNRRWLPFEVNAIIDPFNSQLLHKEMYAQAWYLVQHHFHYWFDLRDICSLEAHNEDFRQTRNEEELLSVYFEPVEPTAAKAVFMTASEIHAKLKMWGNITTPMPLNKFGELLKRRQFIQKRLHGGERGYVVKPIESQADRQSNVIHELLSGDSGDSTF